MRVRRPTAADADALGDLLVDGFETYREFAPAGWMIPDRLELAMGIVAHLDDPERWALVADDDGVIAGHVTLVPAAQHRLPVDDPAVAHLGHLFVLRTHWGGGLARDLHDRAVAEAAARGFTSMRLFTPTGAGRPRRFYEREGWTVAAEPHVEEDLGGLEIIEYRRPSGAGPLFP